MEGKWWIWVLVVFTVCLATRIYYVHEKSVIEGDELTSLTLAYNNIGWGDNTYICPAIPTMPTSCGAICLPTTVGD